MEARSAASKAATFAAAAQTDSAATSEQVNQVNLLRATGDGKAALTAAKLATEKAGAARRAAEQAQSCADTAACENAVADNALSDARSGATATAAPQNLAENQVLLKPSTAVNFLCAPAYGQKRNLLVSSANSKGRPKTMVFCQTAGYRTRSLKLAPMPAGSNIEMKPGVWVLVGSEAYVVAMPGYENFDTAKPVLSVCLALPPYEKYFLARLRHVLLRGDEVSLANVLLYCDC